MARGKANVSLDELLEQQKKLQEKIEFLKASTQKYTDAAAKVKSLLANAGLSIDEVLPYLQEPKERKPRAARGTAIKKPPVSLDHTGAKPEKGATYHHSSQPEDWTYAGTRVPDAWLKLVQDKNLTWASLKAKEAAPVRKAAKKTDTVPA